MWGHYVVREGCKFFDTKMIKEIDFSEFTDVSSDMIKINRNYFKEIWDERFIVSLWNEVLNYSCNE